MKISGAIPSHPMPPPPSCSANREFILAQPQNLPWRLWAPFTYSAMAALVRKLLRRAPGPPPAKLPESRLQRSSLYFLTGVLIDSGRVFFSFRLESGDEFTPSFENRCQLDNRTFPK